ncbi:MAG: TonB-dependent receptor [Gammaproteobacteria bacterium]|nr:TonB-dependent receptor [Gammaproteobacteria bacterium]MDH5584612.1 TonB-dependent receptor [Gammaproteobacteria bacterium]
MVYKNKLLSGSIILALLGVASYSWAQETVPNSSAASDNDGTIDEVTVVGIRSSLRDAVSIKRSYVGTMDAIAAEDFGKFPDGNLAESLARVPGIAIDRSNVEGQTIAVRGFGPEFNLVTLNGRQMPTAPGVWVGGRSFNFGDIASPGVSAVEVFKSANSLLPSGGIGATVNMVTTKPLNVDGTLKSFSISLVEDSTSVAGGTPLETAFLLATNQGRWGVSLSGAYQERTNREEGTRESNWLIPEVMAQSEGYLRVDASNPAYTNNSTRTDGYTFYQEPTAYQIKDNDRVRTNAQATFQFEVTDALVATIDYTYSRVDFDAEGVMFGSWLGGWDTLDATIDTNGAFTDVVVGNRAYDHELIWQSLKNENKSTGFNLEWQLNDAVYLGFDYHNSSAAVEGGELNNSIGFTTDIQGTVTHVNGGGSGINSFSYNTEFLPEHYRATGATIRDGFKENELEQFQLNGGWENQDGGFVSALEFGISRVENKFTKIRNIASYGGTAGADTYDDSLFVRTGLGSFMDGFNTTIGTNYYYAIDPAAALSAFTQNNPGATDADGAVCCTAGGVDHNDRVNETLDSAYLQVEMDTEVGVMPLDIVAGLRYEKSDTESISYYPVPSLLRWDMIAGLVGVNDGTGSVDSPRYGSSSEVLPSLALSLGLTDSQVLRLSFSKTMARPDLFSLSSQLDIGNRDFFQPTASGGNPDLQPLKSNNLDISYENYYSDDSYFGINYFRKEIKDFIGSRTVSGQEINGLTNPAMSALGVQAMDCVQEWVDAGRPDTLFPGDVGATGHCVSQQALWAQGWMNDQQHMGWVVNALAAGVDLSNGYPWSPAECADNGADGWWVCNPGYYDGTSADPLAMFDVTAPYNMNSGTVSGFEFVIQHLFEGTPFGVVFNFTKISGGDVDIDRNAIGEQFILPGLGDSGNFSVFYEDDRHTARLALNYRGETVAGFGNYQQPLYVEERQQLDFSYQFRWKESTTFFLDASNINNETTRLYARYSNMLFLSQQHGPVYKFGARINF